MASTCSDEFSSLKRLQRKGYRRSYPHTFLLHFSYVYCDHDFIRRENVFLPCLLLSKWWIPHIWASFLRNTSDWCSSIFLLSRLWSYFICGFYLDGFSWQSILLLTHSKTTVFFCGGSIRGRRVQFTILAHDHQGGVQLEGRGSI